MKLSEFYSEAKQKQQGYTRNETLEAFDLTTIEELEQSDEDFIKKRLKTCQTYFTDVLDKIDYDDKIKTIFENYNEALTFYVLKKKKNIEITHIPEDNHSTADFCIKYEDEKFCIEQKSLSFAGGNLEYKRNQEEALNGNINIERQLKQGKRIAQSGFWEILPLGAGSLKEQLTRLQEKIANNIKQQQFNSCKTILLIDLTQILDDVNAKECLSLYPSYKGFGVCSGMLWNVVFGRSTDNFYIDPEFEGKKNIDGQLDFDGILVGRDYVKGVIFSCGKTIDTKKYFGFYRYTEQDEKYAQFIEEICDFTNDDTNRFSYTIE